jgi:hypothetical protein
MREVLMHVWVIGFGLVLLANPSTVAAGNERSDTTGGQQSMAGSQTSGIEGQVSIHPVRPVERKGVANQRPYEARIAVLDAAGHEIASVQSDSEGKFRIPLPPGTYVLRPERAGLYPRASEQRVEVSPNRMTRVAIVYDSGKR